MDPIARLGALPPSANGDCAGPRPVRPSEHAGRGILVPVLRLVAPNPRLLLAGAWARRPRAGYVCRDGGGRRRPPQQKRKSLGASPNDKERQSVVGPTSHPQCAAQLERLIRAAGLAVEAVASSIGLDKNWVSDLETYDDELYTNISLAAIQRLALLLNTSIPRLLLLEGAARVGTQVPFKEMVPRLLEHLRVSGQSVDSFGDQVGWDLVSTLADAANIWGWSPDQLRHVSTGLGVDWVSALPTGDDLPPPLQAGA